MKLLGFIIVGFDITDQLLIRYVAFVRYWGKEMGVLLDSTSAMCRLQESI
jgi:hypothetical protein